jgi:hypothetical protein
VAGSPNVLDGTRVVTLADYRADTACTVLSCARMTRQLEVSLLPLGEFETCSDWVPALDKRRRYARIALKTIDVCGFDQRVN